MEDSSETEEYLKSHLEPEEKLTAKDESIVGQFYTPFATEIQQVNESTEVRFKSDNFGAKLVYRPFTESDSSSLPPYRWNFYKRLIGADHLKRLTSLEITDSKGFKLTLDEILPKGAVVCYIPDYRTTKDNNPSLNESNTLIMYGDLAVPANLLVFIHEAGHLADEKLQQVPYAELSRRYGEAIQGRENPLGRPGQKTLKANPKDSAYVLRYERDAWGNVLAKMRGFLSNDPESVFNEGNVSVFVHAAVKKYSDKLREHIPDKVLKPSVKPLTKAA